MQNLFIPTYKSGGYDRTESLLAYRAMLGHTGATR